MSLSLSTSLIKSAPLSIEQEHQYLAKFVPTIPPMAVRLRGLLDCRAFEHAAQLVVSRHEVLRTCFGEEEGEIRQVVLPEILLPVPVTDCSLGSEPERLLRARVALLGEASYRFDITRAPLVRAGLIRLAADDHIFHFTIHHIVSDLWSFKLFFRDLANAYGPFGRLGPLPMQYSDYALWQKEWMSSAKCARHLRYWSATLKNMPQVDLPADPSDGTDSRQAAVKSCVFSTQITEGLNRVARSEVATLFMTLMTVFQVLVLRYTEQNDVVVSSLFANRGRVELEPLIGVFATRLAIRTDLSGDPPFREALRRVQETTWGAYEHQQLSLWQFRRMSAEGAALAASKLIFSFQDVPVHLPGFHGLEVERFECTGMSMFQESGMDWTGRYDQEWQVWKEDSQLRLIVSFRADLFRPERIDRMFEDMRRISEVVGQNPSVRLSQLPVGEKCS